MKLLFPLFFGLMSYGSCEIRNSERAIHKGLDVIKYRMISGVDDIVDITGVAALTSVIACLSLEGVVCNIAGTQINDVITNSNSLITGEHRNQLATRLFHEVMKEHYATTKQEYISKTGSLSYNLAYKFEPPKSRRHKSAGEELKKDTFIRENWISFLLKYAIHSSQAGMKQQMAGDFSEYEFPPLFKAEEGYMPGDIVDPENPNKLVRHDNKYMLEQMTHPFGFLTGADYQGKKIALKCYKDVSAGRRALHNEKDMQKWWAETSRKYNEDTQKDKYAPIAMSTVELNYQHGLERWMFAYEFNPNLGFITDVMHATENDEYRARIVALARKLLKAGIVMKENGFHHCAMNEDNVRVDFDQDRIILQDFSAAIREDSVEKKSKRTPCFHSMYRNSILTIKLKRRKSKEAEIKETETKETEKGVVRVGDDGYSLSPLEDESEEKKKPDEIEKKKKTVWEDDFLSPLEDEIAILWLVIKLFSKIENDQIDLFILKTPLEETLYDYLTTSRSCTGAWLGRNAMGVLRSPDLPSTLLLDRKLQDVGSCSADKQITMLTLVLGALDKDEMDRIKGHKGSAGGRRERSPNNFRASIMNPEESELARSRPPPPGPRPSGGLPKVEQDVRSHPPPTGPRPPGGLPAPKTTRTLQYGVSEEPTPRLAGATNSPPGGAAAASNLSGTTRGKYPSVPMPLPSRKPTARGVYPQEALPLPPFPLKRKRCRSRRATLTEDQMKKLQGEKYDDASLLATRSSRMTFLHSRGKK